jgi:hypothetical protein
MNWFWISMGVLGGLFYLFKKGTHNLEQRKTMLKKHTTEFPAHHIRDEKQDTSKSSASEKNAVTDLPLKSGDKINTTSKTDQTVVDEKNTVEPMPQDNAQATEKTAENSSQASADMESDASSIVSKANAKNEPEEENVSETIKEKVRQTLASGDLDKMTVILEETYDPILRDMLFNQIVPTFYRQRHEQNSKEAFYHFAGKHIEETAAILKALDNSQKGRPARIETFKMMAIALGEDECFDEAINICNIALSLGLEDGTKTGFEGRITRYEKKMTTVTEG